jgi:hypothetical protein
MVATLEQVVYQSLDNAQDNGYGEFLQGPPAAIADDMLELDTSVQGHTADALIPFIQSWQAKQGVTP